jgi:plastocyanin
MKQKPATATKRKSAVTPKRTSPRKNRARAGYTIGCTLAGLSFPRGGRALTVQSGDSVRFVGDSSANPTVSVYEGDFYPGGPPPGTRRSSGLFGPGTAGFEVTGGESKSLPVVAKKGTFTLTIYPDAGGEGMNGTIIVNPGAGD